MRVHRKGYIVGLPQLVRLSLTSMPGLSLLVRPDKVEALSETDDGCSVVHLSNGHQFQVNEEPEEVLRKINSEVLPRSIFSPPAGQWG